MEAEVQMGYQHMSIDEVRKKDDPEAHLEEGFRVWRGCGVAPDVERGTDMIRRAAHEGHPIAQAIMPLEPSRETLEQMFKKCLQFARQGHSIAQHWSAYCYTNELGVERNDEEALKWLHEAAKQKREESLAFLGAHLLLRGDANALDYCRQAAQLGSTTALSLLSSFVEDHEKLTYIRQWTRLHDRRAISMLAGCYEIGRGVEKDVIMATCLGVIALEPRSNTVKPNVALCVKFAALTLLQGETSCASTDKKRERERCRARAGIQVAPCTASQ
jgi:TPR repeat protein